MLMRPWLSIWLSCCALLGPHWLAAQVTWTEETVVPVVERASAIRVDDERNMYLINEDRTRIYKYLAAYQYDSVLSIGGRSHREEGFLDISDLDVSNRQLTIALDRGRQRVVFLHPNLRVMQALDLLNLNSTGRLNAPEDLLATQLAVNSAGELFLLNVLDNRIYKINSFGEWELAFGGTDFGQGSLYEPLALRLNPNNLLFVTDAQQDALLVYDLFGTYRYQVPLTGQAPPDRLDAGLHQLLLWNQEQLSWLDLRRQRLLPMPPPLPRWTDLAWEGNHIYFLTENAVHLYTVSGQE